MGWTPTNTSSRGDSNLSLQHYYDNDSLIRTTSDAQFIGNEVFGETSFMIVLLLIKVVILFAISITENMWIL